MADHGRDPVDLNSLTIRVYPDPVLRRKAVPIPEITDDTRKVVAIMERIMREEEGIGLAAPQVGLSWRMFIVDVPKDPKAKPPKEDEADLLSHTSGLVVYINPVLLKPKGPVERFEEGCLSLPNISGDVVRPRIITIEATGLDGVRFTQHGSGLLARCWQHEMDHLDGVLIIDKMLEGHLAKNKRFIRDLEEGTAR
jgi:peptide deformylase